MGWVDIFTRQRYRDLILVSMQFCRTNKEPETGAYVIMSNHLHLIWTAGKNNLSDIIRDFKTHTSKAITRSVESAPESRRDWLLYMFGFYAKRTHASGYLKYEWATIIRKSSIRGVFYEPN